MDEKQALKALMDCFYDNGEGSYEWSFTKGASIADCNKELNDFLVRFMEAKRQDEPQERRMNDGH